MKGRNGWARRNVSSRTVNRVCFVPRSSLGAAVSEFSAGLQQYPESGFNRHQGSFLEKAKEFAGEDGIGVILDPVGGAYLEDNLKLLGLNGRLVLIGLMGGNKTEIDLAALMMKRLRVIGSTLRARPNVEKAQVMSQLFEKVWPKIESGEIRAIVDTVFPIEQVDEAHKLVSTDATIGKVVLSVKSEA